MAKIIKIQTIAGSFLRQPVSVKIKAQRNGSVYFIVVFFMEDFTLLGTHYSMVSLALGFNRTPASGRLESFWGH